MRALVFSLAALLAAIPATSGAATQSGTSGAAAVAAVRQFIDGLNNGDVKSTLAACAPETIIIDEFPPHHWQGRDACSQWLNAFAAYDKAQGISGDFVSLGAPKVTSVTGNYAYVVFPSTYRYKRHGKPVLEDAATLTAALEKMGGVWRITGWAWAQ